jgi:hypothetical protein
LFAGYWVSTLRSANEQFEQIMLIRSDAIFEAAMGAAKVTREAVQTASEKWYEMINALAVVNGPVAYKHIIDHINQPVSESYNVAARRRSRKTSYKDTAPFLLPPPDTLEPSPMEE